MNSTQLVINELNKAVSTIQDKVVHYAPQAWQIMCQLKQIDSVQNLALGLMFLIMALGFLKCGFWGIGKANETKWEEPGYCVVGVFSIIGIVGFAIGTLYEWLDVWNWIGIFNPGLAIAHDILAKIIQ